MLWHDITIAGTGSWIPPIRPEHDPWGGTQAGPSSMAAANGFTSAAVSTGETATQMAARAALLALRHAEVPSADVSLLAHATFQDEDHYTPAPYLLRVLGATRTTGIEVGAASDGGAAALVTAAEHLTAQPTAPAALVTAGARFPHQRWGHVRDIGYVAGDAGAAAVLTRGTGFARLLATAQAAEPELEVLTRAGEQGTAAGDGRRFLAEQTGLLPHIGALQRRTRHCVDTVLGETGLAAADISHVVAIAIGSAVLDLVLSGPPLHRRATDSSWTFGRHLGHAGPCDVLLALDRMFRTGALRVGDHVLVVSFGLGFRWTTALLEITRPPPGATTPDRRTR
ncbi:3-oxoacyl-[acyl-carrier-protein] synthase III C-terminal domain-containing protein [Micromonospora matsumotoense]|uniref:3-oxoacyl-[acyl-carrier-protein] synthase III C-terminal domain-containing protein n=1 Tax=Micromonospora matsumotoense TaxID=121616 RepID=UPI00343B414E